MNTNLCFIGAGNMATSLIGGLLARQSKPSQITAYDINTGQLGRLADDFAIRTSTDIIESTRKAGIILLAVKPQVLQSVCEQMTLVTDDREPLFISIVAGIRTADINRWLGGSRAVVRCMPNTPALLRLGATALYANAQVSARHKQVAQSIMDSVGVTSWVKEEALLDAVTAISGSGPAYFFYFIELLQAAGESLGLDADTVRTLVRQTALGAATMAQHEDIVELRAQVTSAKGTTEQAILSLQNNGLDSLVAEAAQAAFERSIEIATELGANPPEHLDQS